MSESPADRFQRVDAVFDAAMDLPPAEQPAFLKAICGDDDALRDEVLGLLAAYHDSSGFLDAPVAEVARPLFPNAVAAAMPERIGAFRIVSEIGRGGMGRVYLGERDDGQFDQRVAIKVIHHTAPGLVRRFLEERRILSMLQHASIARLLDGGVTAGGLPYFVLELVEGEPIDRYCERGSLSIEERLALVAMVGDAVGYAHQRLVIHRDLKPTNILVTAEGEVKLLDFGIAKLLGGAGADVTRTEGTLLTPEFAAPEQLLGTAVSTATDVYALGVLLYLLLSGRRPYELNGQPPVEIIRMVCDDDPQPPSAVAPAVMRRHLRSDLDAIVMKALRKEQQQRYATVYELTDDIRRHLTGRPVHAQRQTTRYRAGRFVRRHATAVAASVALLAGTAAYVGTVLVQRARIEDALSEATISAQKAEQVTAFVLSLFQASERGQAFADTVTARELLNRGLLAARAVVGQPQVRAQLLDAVGHIHMQLGEFTAARSVFQEALDARREVVADDHLEVAASLMNIADAAHRMDGHEDAVLLRGRALDIRRSALGPRHPLTLESVYWHAHELHETHNTDAAWQLFDKWVEGIAALPEKVDAERASQYVRLGQLMLHRGDRERAESLIRRGIDMRRTIFGERHESIATAHSQLAWVYMSDGRLADSEREERVAVDMLRSLHPLGHPDLADALRGLAVTLHRQHRWAEAEQLYLEQQALVRRFYGEDHMSFGRSAEDLGLVVSHLRRDEEAESYLRTAVDIYTRHVGAGSLLTRRAEAVLGEALRKQGRSREAEPLLLAAYEAFSKRSPPGFEYALRVASDGLVALYEAEGRTDVAARYSAPQR